MTNLRLTCLVALGLGGVVWAGTPKTVHTLEDTKNATILSPVDIDGDGDMDLLTTGLRGIAALDLDKDGDLDVIGVAPLRGLFWFENMGQAKAFSPPKLIAKKASEHLAVGDFDGDGDLDAMTGGDAPTLHLNEDGKGRKWSSSKPFPGIKGMSSAKAYSPQACDIDGDGDLDIVCSDGYGISKLVNEGGIWKNVRLWTGSSSEKFGGLQARDFDGDGDVDVVAAARSQAVYLNNMDGKGTLAPEVTKLEFSIHFVDAGDIDGDGDVDLVVGARDASKVAWLAWDAEEEEFTVQVLDHDDYLKSNANGIRLVDMDGDKDLDILFSSSNYSVARGVVWLETR